MINRNAIFLPRGEGSLNPDARTDLGLDYLIKLISKFNSHKGYYSDVGETDIYVKGLLEGPLEYKENILFRQEIYQDILESDVLRKGLSKTVKDLFEIYKEIEWENYEDPTTLINCRESVINDKLDSFEETIISLEKILSKANSEGLTELREFVSQIKNDDGFKLIHEDKAAYLTAYASKVLNLKHAIRWRSKTKKYLERWAGKIVDLHETKKRFLLFSERHSLVDSAKQLNAYLMVSEFLLDLKEKGAELCKPIIFDKEKRKAKIIGASNPLLYHLVKSVVPYEKITYSPRWNFCFVTGPNQGGKTTYSRTDGLLTVMALSGSFIPAQYAEISMVDDIYTHFVRPDDFIQGAGRCLNEARRMKYILQNATSFSLIIVDEPTGATSHIEGIDVSKKVWIENLYRLNPTIFYTTHMHELAEFYKNECGIKNRQVEIDLKNMKPNYTFRVKPGVGEKSYAMELLMSEGLGPQDMKNIIDRRIEKGKIDVKYLRKKPLRS